MNYLASRLREYLCEPGCPLCALLREQDERYLDTIFWEMVNDPRLRNQLVKDGGLCAYHLHFLYEKRPSVLGIAIIFKDLLLHFLQGELPDSKNIKCRLCVRNQELEKRACEVLMKQWPVWKEEWGKYTFLCRNHFRLFSAKDQISAEICSASEKALRELLELTNSFVEKFDYQKATLSFDWIEKESWQYLLEFFASLPLRKNAFKR